MWLSRKKKSLFIRGQILATMKGSVSSLFKAVSKTLRAGTKRSEGTEVTGLMAAVFFHAHG